MSLRHRTIALRLVSGVMMAFLLFRPFLIFSLSLSLSLIFSALANLIPLRARLIFVQSAIYYRVFVVKGNEIFFDKHDSMNGVS